MKTPEQIADFIALRIGHIYFRPLMYSGSPDNIELILHYYHELWSEIYEKVEIYESAKNLIREEQKSGVRGFAYHYQRDNPKAEDKEIFEYVVSQWRRISKRVGLPIPHITISDIRAD